MAAGAIGPLRKCRWCAFLAARTPKGAAELWRHVRAEHADERWPGERSEPLRDGRHGVEIHG